MIESFDFRLHSPFASEVRILLVECRMICDTKPEGGLRAGTSTWYCYGNEYTGSQFTISRLTIIQTDAR